MKPHSSRRRPQSSFSALGTTLSPDLLVQALTHRSFSHEHPGVANYERLEFLGDAVLELVSTETLFTIHPDMTEGQLAKMRAKAVSEDALSAIARQAQWAPTFCWVTEKPSRAARRRTPSMRHRGIAHRRDLHPTRHRRGAQVIHRLIDDTLAEVAAEGPALDWKTSLTVKAHGLGWMSLSTIWRSPARNTQIFTARVSLGEKGDIIGIGKGSSKRKAQLAAAEAGWKSLDSFKTRTK